MEVAVPVSPVDFNFDSACSSPYMTAPSSPQRFGNFFFSSAPTSPSHAAAFYYDFNDFDSPYVDGRSSSASEIPFLWEDLPGIVKSGGDACSSVADDDFQFDFSGQLERTSLSADELFDCGKIRALKPPPSNRVTDSISSSTASSRISQGKRVVQEAVSPRHHRRRDTDPLEEAFKATTQRNGDGKRGRERTNMSSSSRSSSSIKRSGSRSLSPLRVSDIMLDPDQEIGTKPMVPSTTSNNEKQHSISSSASFLSAFSFSRGQRRWRIRDLLLFRSASEGRATEKKAVEEMKNSSFRSIESLSSVSSSRRRGSISAHELHYKTNRAVSEELRKKTSLPYKHGLLGCLGFNSSMQRSFSRSFGSLARA
ncbi:uncharacterized protein LOC101207472 [Cucumis sativus]|uniref:Calmodulin-binding protein n=1 Tax=Cucumis sativus TaxID=3659 RepID=A0A0A0K384_CUCSA|nr:uncharacterized protein LOC101207472 [Cucumis sativus]KGN43943.1 hypothetical protein Csa_017342 [Cucumis sativus]